MITRIVAPASTTAPGRVAARTDRQHRLEVDVTVAVNIEVGECGIRSLDFACLARAAAAARSSTRARSTSCCEIALGEQSLARSRHLCVVECGSLLPDVRDRLRLIGPGGVASSLCRVATT